MTESVLPVCKQGADRFKTAFFSFFYLLFLLAVLETGLRIQQKTGPYYDLEFSKWSLDLLSGDLNHGPSPKEDYDADGIQRSRLRPSSYPEGTKPFSILFMGDSFIQGYGPSDNLPQHVWEYFQTTELKTAPLLLLNAGYSSYSPSIFIPQAKKTCACPQTGYGGRGH